MRQGQLIASIVKSEGLFRFLDWMIWSEIYQKQQLHSFEQYRLGYGLMALGYHRMECVMYVLPAYVFVDHVQICGTFCPWWWGARRLRMVWVDYIERISGEKGLGAESMVPPKKTTAKKSFYYIRTWTMCIRWRSKVVVVKLPSKRYIKGDVLGHQNCVRTPLKLLHRQRGKLPTTSLWTKMGNVF